MLSLFKKKPSTSVQAFKKVKSTVRPSQERVLKAINQLQPCHYRQVSARLNTIEGCVTPRIAELKRKGYITVSHVSKGQTSARVNYYRVTGRGLKYLLAAAKEES